MWDCFALICIDVQSADSDYPIGHAGDIQSASPALQQPNTDGDWGDARQKNSSLVSPINSQDSEDKIACSICHQADPVMFALEVISWTLQSLQYC